MTARAEPTVIAVPLTGGDTDAAAGHKYAALGIGSGPEDEVSEQVEALLERIATGFIPEDRALATTRLKELVIEREDLFLSSEFPQERENRPLRIGTVGKGGQGERVYSPKGHAITLSAFGGGIGAKTGMYLVDGLVRRLHPEECRRLMGFPEGFRLHPRRNVCYKQFGNSVAVPVVREIVATIDRFLDGQSRRAA